MNWLRLNMRYSLRTVGARGVIPMRRAAMGNRILVLSWSLCLKSDALCALKTLQITAQSGWMPCYSGDVESDQVLFDFLPGGFVVRTATC